MLYDWMLDIQIVLHILYKLFTLGQHQTEATLRFHTTVQLSYGNVILVSYFRLVSFQTLQKGDN